MNYGLVIAEKHNAFVGKSIPPQVRVLARQYLCLADLAVGGFANSLETICGKKSLQTPTKVPRRHQSRVLKNESLPMKLIRIRQPIPVRNECFPSLKILEEPKT